MKPVAPALIEVIWNERIVSLEYQWINQAGIAPFAKEEGAHKQAPLILFLHEGLGSLQMWGDFPLKLCTALNMEGLVYSRPGYGNSTLRQDNENWQLDFMHQQAYLVLSALLEGLKINPMERDLFLFGHSDGGSIALLYAAKFKQGLKGLIAVAPHHKVEDITLTNIELARTAYLEGKLKAALAKYHKDTDSAFWGWNRIWLNPEFKTWNILKDIKGIEAPTLLIQGINDQYGTMEQIEAIQRLNPHSRVIAIENSGHSPHKDNQEKLIKYCKDFLIVYT